MTNVGAFGCILTLWNNNYVEVWLSVSFDHVLIVNGCLKKDATSFWLADVYAPCKGKVEVNNHCGRVGKYYSEYRRF